MGRDRPHPNHCANVRATNDTIILRHSGRIYARRVEREPDIQSIPGDQSTKKADKKRPGHVQSSKQQQAQRLQSSSPLSDREVG